MNTVTTLYLKAAVILIGLPVLTLCIFWLPNSDGYVHFFVIAGAYAAAVTYFYSLYQAFRLLNYIDRKKAFSELSVNALKKIKYCAIVIGIIFTAILPFLFPIAEADDAPGLAGIPMVIVFASSVVATFAAVLQKLLKDAITLKNDNDLTI